MSFDTESRAGGYTGNIPVAAGAALEAGALVVVYQGEALDVASALAAVGGVVVGLATNDALAAADVIAQRGVAILHPADGQAATMAGRYVYATDDETVTFTPGTVKAGFCIGIAEDGKAIVDTLQAASAPDPV